MHLTQFEAGPEDGAAAPPPHQQDDQLPGAVDENYYKGWKPLKDVIVYPPGHDLPSDIVMARRKKSILLLL